MIDTVIQVVHVASSIILILIILVQIGKGASMSNLFGGGSSEAVFSGAGGDVFMKKLTIVFAAVFMLTSLGLTVMSSRSSIKTVMDKVPQTAPPAGVGVGLEEKAPAVEVPVPSEEKPAKPAEPFDVD